MNWETLSNKLEWTEKEREWAREELRKSCETARPEGWETTQLPGLETNKQHKGTTL